MLSVAGMLAFFIMIFASLRQGRPAIRNSFGVSRFNTRLNFYLYEVARITFISNAGRNLSRYNRVDSIKLDYLDLVNNEILEVTLYSYVLVEDSSSTHTNL